MTASTASTSLTAVELRDVARARELAGLRGKDLLEFAGTDDLGYACADALGAAQVTLTALVGIVERLSAG